MDLDDLLDDIDIDALPSAPVNIKVNGNEKSNIPIQEIKHKVENTSSTASVISSDIKPWLAASANVPKEFREKWTKMAKVDCGATISSPFDVSNAYRLWDSSTSGGKVGIHKCLQELIRKAAQRCELDDNKLAKVLNLANPVTDGENGPKIQEAFAKQLITDLSSDILSDPNYDPDRFPALTLLLVDL